VHAARRGSPGRTSEVPLKTRVRALREQHGWSQGDLAREREVSRQTVNAIENARYDPSLPLAFKIAARCRLPIEDGCTP